MKGKQIKDLYGLQYDNRSYPLSVWYNQLIDKTIDQISLRDVFSMISNDILPEVAIDKAIEFFVSDPFAGENYPGQILESFVKNSDIFFNSKSPQLTKMLQIIKTMDDMMAKSKEEWGYEYDFDGNGCNEYLKLLENAKLIISRKEQEMNDYCRNFGGVK